MEFLLINHPLDCPICDRAANALQDQAMAMAVGVRATTRTSGRSKTNIWADRQTAMTAASCTRCIASPTRVRGRGNGQLFRGEDAQITSYLEKRCSPNYRHLVDCAPWCLLRSRVVDFAVGAEKSGIDVMDALGTNVRFDVRQRRDVASCRGSTSGELGMGARQDAHHVDALVRNRLDRPWVLTGKASRGELGRGARPVASSLRKRRGSCGDCRRLSTRDDVAPRRARGGWSGMLAGGDRARL